ncbi:Electron transfer DM13 [Roseovarius albus]|uniref:Electron transfer DM13 n=1 Tax=Roseovarius albus TaxID=1247867 RepID=A0A1X6Z486_9RHOB|nr:DM13 domain-containing protein [Roseovarius albus]SLN40510.1 Electron transfer DM13 [Roseovarius albus]
MTNRRTFLKYTASVGATAIATGLTPAFAGGHGRIGEFSGRNNHITTGKAELAKNEVVLFKDFSLDGAPDPRVGLGKDGKYDPKTDLGKLKKLKGKQSYALPADVDVSKYNEVYIWCRKFSVPLGVAKLDAAH